MWSFKLEWKSAKKNKQILNLLRLRDLTIQGMAVVLNTMLMSKLWYTLSVISMAKRAQGSLEKELCTFGVFQN